MREIKALNIMHVASFVGNVGDNLNHSGLYKILRDTFNIKFNIEKIEIRDFYRIRNIKKFDDNFIIQANKSDLLIIGGGNFFEPWVNESKTGTTINMSEEIFNKIKVPILFFGIGFDIYKGFTMHSLEKLRDFVNIIIHSKKCFLTFRNDGSIKNIVKCLGHKYEDICEVPDGAFYNNMPCDNISPDSDNILINVAADILKIKCNSDEISSFINNITKFIILSTYDKYKFIFAPHIFKDLEIINDIIKLLPDKIIRERISILPYTQYDIDRNFTFEFYNMSRLCISMRFHANVYPISRNIPTIALSTEGNKITDLYHGLNLEERLINIKDNMFLSNLLKMIDDTFNNYENIITDYKSANLKINYEFDNFKYELRQKFKEWELI